MWSLATCAGYEVGARLRAMLRDPSTIPRDDAATLQARHGARTETDWRLDRVAAATKAGWQFDLLFSNTRDGSGTGRRERATVVLSKPRTGTVPPASVTIERRSSFGMAGDEVVGAAAYWDEYLFASLDHDRRQAWASPIRLSANDASCGALGLGFRFDAPRDQLADIVALLARPLPGGGFELVVVTNQRLGF